jgi:ComF family protein
VKIRGECRGRRDKLSHFFAKKLYSVARELLPPACVACGGPGDDAPVCRPCRRDWPALGPACPRCALPSAGGAWCADCFVKPPPLAFTIAAFRYAFPVDRIVQALKYRGTLALADVLGDALAEAACATPLPACDALLALPLAAARQRERGFNQAAEIARRASSALSLPLVTGLARVRDTPPQAGLAWRERAANMRGAFAATRSFAGARVAIVDDVLTTGATLDAAARALGRAGAAQVGALVVARALRSG